jgi:hypothetical protein
LANTVFHSKLTIEAGSASTDAVTKSQLDAAEAAAKARAAHTGTQTASTISDFNTAVDSRIETVLDVAGAPAALNTLNEIAAALNDDANYAATVTTALGDLDSRIDTLESSSGAGGYTTLVGDGSASSINVTHGLGTTSVLVQVFKVSDGATVFPVVTRTSTTVVNIDFGATTPTSNQFRVLVYKVA